MRDEMKLFVDVNLFIDILEKRKGWEESFFIIRDVVEGKNEGYISALTPAIIYFLRRRSFSEQQAREDVKDSIEGLNIVDLTMEVIELAINEVKIKDFEDALQYHSARLTTKVFVTRNKRHFEKVKDGIEVLTPEEFINRYGSLVY